MPEREHGGLPGGQPDPGGRGGVIHVEADRRGQEQPVGAAPGGEPAGDGNQDGVDEPVLRPGRVADLRLDLAASAGQRAQQRTRGVCTQVVAALVAADREGVGEYRGAVARW